MSDGAGRQRLYRQRHRAGLVVLKVPADRFWLVDALIATGRLSEADADNMAKVEAALADVVADWHEKNRSGRYV